MSYKTNPEILEQLLVGSDLDDETSRVLMKRWLNNEILDVQTGAFLSALRAKGANGTELSSMAEELLNVCAQLRRTIIREVKWLSLGRGRFGLQFGLLGLADL